MVALVLFAQLVVSDPMYASPALRGLVDSAATANRLVPASLLGYRARVQTEMALVQRSSDGLEGAMQVEQVALDVIWRRSGAFEQHAIGYRSSAMTYTGASVFQLDTWSVPVLYGNRFDLFFGPDSVNLRKHGKAGPIEAFPSVHPFAEDRDALYRFRGGDTVATIRIGARAIPIVRILIEPRLTPARRTTVFRGEIDVDGVSKQIARMRGEILEVGPTGMGQRVGEALVRYAGYVELVNREVEGRYWLPAFQRVDFQVALPPVGRAGLILRIQSRFADFVIDADATVPSNAQAADTLVPFSRPLVIATADSLRRFTDWQFAIGDPTAGVRADDFWTDTIAASVFLPGASQGRVTMGTLRFRDTFHYDRIEGAFTGYGVGIPLPTKGTLQINGGWAWSERVARGSATASWPRDRWRVELLASRTLDMTNDFRHPFDPGPTVQSLLSARDEFDYLDRRQVRVGVFRASSRAAPLQLRFETGPGQDRAVVPHVSRGLARTDTVSVQRRNRGVREGDYVLSTARVDYHPEREGRFVAAGISGFASYERGDGELAWQRLEGRIHHRAIRGAFVVEAGAEGGTLFGSAPPPQQVFELGGRPRLPEHDYKTFGGDRAALVELRVQYRLPFLQSPILVKGQRFVGASPSVAIESQSGWADAVADGTIRALGELGTIADPSTGSTGPISGPTHGLPTTLAIGLRVFGETVFVGGIKALDSRRPWRAIFRLTPPF